MANCKLFCPEQCPGKKNSKSDSELALLTKYAYTHPELDCGIFIAPNILERIKGSEKYTVLERLQNTDLFQKY